MAQRTKIFVPDDALVWVNADILNDSDPVNIEVEVSDEEYLRNSRLPTIKKVSLKALKLESFPLQNEIDDAGVDDMTTLNFLHEASILDNLRRRFFSLKPYTYTGEICIAVNPYQWLNIYSEESRDRYLHTSRFELPPHVYATSASAYKGLRDHNKNQSILVSGESGAGKTETVKILMSHVAQISGKPEDTTIEKVLKANPLLESFGNAKTGRNDNSSRFGKFTQLQFDLQSRLVGSRCVTYLLEKTRVICQGDLNERNYHIFHEVFAAPESVKESLFLGGKTCKDFFYTNQGDTVTHTIEHVPDSERFLSTIRTLELIGVNEKTREQILQIIAGIVHMGQISFVGDADTSRIDPAVPESTIENCCTMLGLVPQAFKDRIVVRNVDAAGEALQVALSKEQAIDGRDALSKETYSRLFSWLVKVINESTSPSAQDSNRNRIIGLLDIFGFESFKVNRFEQLCINYTNEKLQQKFTSDVLQNVQAEYREEGLDWANIEYKDNNDVLDLLEGKLGFIALLNEECLMPKGSNSNFLNKIKNTFKENPLFSLSVQLSKDEFCIQHYAGKVSYNVTGFLERNKDALPPEMRLLMLTSTNELVAQIFTPLVVGGGENGEDSAATAVSGKDKGLTRHQSQSFMKADTVFTKFRSQLISLMDSISSTNVNYVRCIKPNSNKSKNEYNRPMVVEQLRCSGIIEAVKVSRAAYPYRIPHKEFMSRFHCLQPTKWWIAEEKKQASSDAGHESEAMKARNLMKLQCQIILNSYTAQFNALPVKGSSTSSKIKKPFEIGKSKVFFSDGVLELFERQRTQALGAQCIIIQRKFKTRRTRKAFLFQRACAILAQTFYRCRSKARKYGLILAYTRCIQSNFRRFSAMRLLVRMRRFYRATQIQSFFRMKKLRRRYLTAKRGVIVLGSIAKMMTQRRKFIQMRNKAREDAQLVNQLEIVRQALAQEQQERLKLESELRAKANVALEEQQRQQELLDKANKEKEQKLAEENEALRRMIEELRQSKEAAAVASAGASTPSAAPVAPASPVVETKTVIVEVATPPPAPVVVTVAPSDYDAMKEELAKMEKMKAEMNEMSRLLQLQKEEHERQLQQQIELLKQQAEQQAAAMAAAAIAAAAAAQPPPAPVVSPTLRRPSAGRRPSGSERRPSGTERRPSGTGVPPPSDSVRISPRMTFSKHLPNGHSSNANGNSGTNGTGAGHAHHASHSNHISHGATSAGRAGRSAVLRKANPTGRSHSISTSGLHPHKQVHVHNGVKALRDIKMVEKLKSTESELAQYKKKIEQLEAMNRKLKTKGHQPPSQSTDADMSSDSDDSREDGRGATEEELQVELENRKSDFNSYLESFKDLTELMVDEDGNPLYKPYEHVEAEFDENGNEILPPGVLPPDFSYLTHVSDDDEDIDGDDESETGGDGDAAAAALNEEEAMQRRIHNSGMRDSDDEFSRGGFSTAPSDVDDLDADSTANAEEEGEEGDASSDAGLGDGGDRESFDPYSAYPDEHGETGVPEKVGASGGTNGKGRSSESFDITDVYARPAVKGKAGSTPNTAASSTPGQHRSMSVTAAVMNSDTKTQTPVRSASMLSMKGGSSNGKSFTTPQTDAGGRGASNGVISPVPLVSTPFASDANELAGDPTQMTPLQIRKASLLSPQDNEENLQEARETLHAAIDSQDLDTIHEVLSAFPKAARSITEGGMTVLHVACKSNSIELVQTLLQYNFHVDAVDEKGKTALHHCRDMNIIHLLCSEGADVNKTDHAGWTPLLEYVHCENVSCVHAIMPFHPNLAKGDPVSLRTPLHVAADLGNAELLMALISHVPAGFNFDQPDADGYTALHLAASSDRDSQGTLAIMMTLLNRGASAVMCNERGVTPLHLICANRSLSQLNLAEPIVELLLSINADPNAQDVDGCTPLIVACAYREWGLCKLLLEAGGDLNVPCNMSSTFLAGDGRLSASKEKNDLKTVAMMEKADCTASDLMTKTSRYKLFHYICVPQARIPGETRDRCMNCANFFTDGSFFNISSGRHHCRHCLRVICSDCSPKQLPRSQMPAFVTSNNTETSMRVCLVCYDVLKDRADAAAAEAAKVAGTSVKKGTFW